MIVTLMLALAVAQTPKLADGGRDLRVPHLKPEVSKPFEWSSAEIAAQVKGEARLNCGIDQQGHTHDCQVTQAPPHLSEQHLLTWASGLVFEPARMGNVIVDTPSFEIVHRFEVSPDLDDSPGDGSDEKPALDTAVMTKPTPRTFPAFPWTQKQLDARSEGIALVQCTLTRTGHTRSCRVLKTPAGFENSQILTYASGLVFTPALAADGKPVAIKSFTIPIRLKVP